MPTRFIRGPWRPRTGIAFSAERDEHVMYTLRRTRLIATMGWIAASFAFWPTSAAFAADEISFEPAIGFFQLPEGYLLGRCSAVATNSKGEVYLLHRGRNPVICVDASGKFLRSWDNEHLGTPHGLRVDRQDNVWVTDIGRHRVLKFDPTGELLLVLGTGKPGAAGDEFNQPTDIAFAADGSVYVSDGYGNSRVLKFTAAGRLIKTWGTRGDKRGEFNLPHAIVVDARDRVLVGDRENNRIQIFDSDGQPLGQWGGFAPYGLAIDHSGHLFVADGRAHQVLRLDAAGKVQQRWGRLGKAPGEFALPHMLAFDATNNLFVAEVEGMRFQKLLRK